MTGDHAAAFENALLSLNRTEAARILAASAGEQSAIETVDTTVVKALEGIGSKWEKGDISLSQVYMSGRICEDLVEKMLPPEGPERKDRPRMAIAVLEDYHFLGKRIVSSVLRAGGYSLVDYGRIEADDLVTRSVKDGLDILFISTLMLPSALRVKYVTEALRIKGNGTKVIVGGAPFLFDETLWLEVGADAMGKSASDALAFVTAAEGGVS